MESVVSTKAGTIRGQATPDGTHVFLGMPYAEPPVSAGRYLAPAPVAGWDGIRDATAYGPTAPQPEHGFTLIPEPVVPGEEFLNLNVFTPDLGAAGLPVLVWIHGGGFMSGCNRSPWYRGDSFARDGVVLVSINYRLGAEGFLALADAPANRAALDWIAALEWVQENITAFGGDPARVTIGGQSAGGGACAALLAVPRAKGLFGQAILASGAAQLQVSTVAATELASRFAAELHIEPTRQAFARVPIPDVVAVQRRLTSSAPSADPVAMAARFAARGVLPFGPWPDGDLLPSSPLEAVAAGAGQDVPVLAGTTAEEFTAVARMGPVVPDQATLLGALAALGLPDDRAREYVSAGAGQDLATLLGQAITDRTFRIPVVQFAEGRAASVADTYLYEFRWRSPAMGGMLGAAHCVDLPFAFDLLGAEGVAAAVGDDPPQALADSIHRAWVEFVSTGAPGWPGYRPEQRTTMLFDTVSRVADDPVRSMRTIWAGI